VTDRFTDRTGIDVTYEALPPTKLNAALSATIADGPPAVVILPQLGLVHRLVECQIAKPLPTAVQQAVNENYDPRWRQFGMLDGIPYGLVFKSTNKSLMWYDARVLRKTRLREPKTWNQFVDSSQGLSKQGYTPISIGGADGWVLTDWFENVYLQIAGPEKYDALATHKIPWTDPSVTKALAILAQLWSQHNLLVPRPADTSFNRSVENVFVLGEGVFVFEGDFVGDRIADNGWATPGKEARFFTFPSLQSGPQSAVVGGDTAVMLDDSSETAAFMQYLATPDAAQIWVNAGSFISPINGIDPQAYPAAVTRQSVRDLRRATIVRYDLSDQQPLAFGGTSRAGMYQSLQEFLRHPEDPAQRAEQLEVKASRVYEAAIQQPCPGR